MGDYTLRQRLLELDNLRLGKVRVVAEVKLLQIREPDQGTQICELVIMEPKHFHLREPSQGAHISELFAPELELCYLLQIRLGEFASRLLDFLPNRRLDRCLGFGAVGDDLR